MDREKEYDGVEDVKLNENYTQRKNWKVGGNNGFNAEWHKMKKNKPQN